MDSSMLARRVASPLVVASSASTVEQTAETQQTRKSRLRGEHVFTSATFVLHVRRCTTISFGHLFSQGRDGIESQEPPVRQWSGYGTKQPFLENQSLADVGS